MIKTEQLTKRYDSLTAVDDVSFQVGPGEVLGFLGPNGAGKTTTMRMLAGFVTPTSGRANICGHDVESEPLKAKAALGYLPEGAPLYGEMTVQRFLEFIADLRSLTGARRAQRLGHVIEHLQLGGVLDQTIETLSKGFRRRVGLAQAIMHDPPVLILDEPTDGLDPNQKHEVRTLINDMASDKIIVISTHILEEVGAVCTRAIIISRGRIMRNVGIIMRRELASYFATPLAYVFIVIFLFLANVFTFYLGHLYESGQADLYPFFTFHPWLYLFLIPAISMKLWSEERKSGSIE